MSNELSGRPGQGTPPPMLVLHVGPLPPPLGGIELAIVAMLECPELAAVAQDVFNTSRGQAMSVVGRKRPTLERVRRRFSLGRALRRRVRADRPDVVHFHCGSDGTFDQVGFLLLLWTTTRYGAKFVLHFHTDFSVAALPGRSWLRRLLFRCLCAPASVIFVPTEHHRATLAQLGMRQRVVAVSNMCDETLLDLAAPRAGGEAEVVGLFIGRLTDSKGFFDLLEVADQLNARGLRVRFEVAGLPSTTNDERRIAEQIRVRGLENIVRLMGAVSGAAKLDLFQRADLVVLPSHTESFGLVAIEAMAAGLPVVASHCTGLGSIVVPGVTGMLAEPRNVVAFVEAISTLAEDAELGRQMGLAGRERYLEYYSVASVGRLLAREYARLGRLPRSSSDRSQPGRRSTPDDAPLLSASEAIRPAETW